MEKIVRSSVGNVKLEPTATLLPDYVQMVAKTTGYLLSVQVTLCFILNIEENDELRIKKRMPKGYSHCTDSFFYSFRSVVHISEVCILLGF